MTATGYKRPKKSNMKGKKHITICSRPFAALTQTVRTALPAQLNRYVFMK